MAENKAETKPAKKIGRPTKYNQRIAAKFCEQIALGQSMRTVCKMDGMPAPKVIFSWMHTHEDFSKQYARACEERAEAYVEEIFDIADDGSNDWMETYYPNGKPKGWEVNNEAIQRSRLRVDSRKWYASKVKPKKYGDKLDLTTGGDKLPTPIFGGSSIQSASPEPGTVTKD